ncbi:Protein max [Lamellibrachia satsuma]|nr:Protein max [Lamellibrachia satsuma]
MSDDDRDGDIDIESDEDDDGDGSAMGGEFATQAEKRAHHNALERKRRDHIKESFHSLRDSVPALQGEKASRAQILKQATDYIQYMSKKNSIIQHDIDDVKKQNQVLEQQVRALEKAKAAGTYINKSSIMENNVSTTVQYGASDSDNSDLEVKMSKRKRLKTAR